MRRKDNLWFVQLKSKKSARLLPSPGLFSMFSESEGEKFGWKIHRPGFAWAKQTLFFERDPSGVFLKAVEVPSAP